MKNEPTTDPKKERKKLINRTWNTYVRTLPTEEACLENLLSRIYPRGLHCCDGDRVVREVGARKFRCQNCGQTNWPLADTFFERIRRIRPWLGRIWFYEHGVPVNSSEFHVLAEIAYSTSHEMFARFSLVLEHEMSGESEADSIDFIEILRKRSKETPPREHPRAELSTLQDLDGRETYDDLGTRFSEELGASHLECIEPLAFEEEGADLLNDAILDLLSSETPTNIDALVARSDITIGKVSASLTYLEILGAVRQMPGGNYLKVAPNDSRRKPPAVSTKVKEIVEFISFHFHGVSRKRLQHYVATYWYLMSNRTDLVSTCMRFGAVSKGHIAEYISPRILKVS